MRESTRKFCPLIIIIIIIIMLSLDNAGCCLHLLVGDGRHFGNIEGVLGLV